jgi:hypothetical protein
MASTGDTRTWRLLALVGLASFVAPLSMAEGLMDPLAQWVRHHHGFSARSLAIPGLAQFFLAPVVAVLSDRVALAGGRRRGWMLLTALAAAACWWKFDPAGTGGVSSPTGTMGLLFLAQAVLVIACGLAVDVAQPAARTGAAAAINRIGLHGAFIAATFLRPLLDPRGTQPTARLIAGAFALLAVATALLGKEGPPPSRSYDTKLRSSGFWGCMLLLLWVESLGHVSTFVVKARDGAGFVPTAGILAPLALLLACVYLALASSMTPRRLPTLAFALGVASTLAAVGSAVLPSHIAHIATPLLVAAAWLPTVDVGMRFVRRESAALGMWCLFVLPRFVSRAFATPLLVGLGAPPMSVTAIVGFSIGLLVVGAFGWRLSGRAVAAAP